MNLKEGVNNINKRGLHEKQKNHIKVNKSRIKYAYSPSDLVYRRKISPDKLEAKWEGPFEVESVNASKVMPF